ncbi:MAG: hypothetical protein J5817_00115 [Treponema sp.]|nr:hypothetical protein [Treponema sp.]
MVFMNQKMVNVLDKKTSADNKERADVIIKDILENTILKNDWLLYDKDKKIQKSTISAQWAKETFSDFVGYEATVNEIRYDKKDFSDINFFYLVNKLSNELETKFHRKIVLYLSLHATDVDIRFHTFRPIENDWLSENLDSYDNPILCMKQLH